MYFKYTKRLSEEGGYCFAIIKVEWFKVFERDNFVYFRVNNLKDFTVGTEMTMNCLKVLQNVEEELVRSFKENESFVNLNKVVNKANER